MAPGPSRGPVGVLNINVEEFNELVFEEHRERGADQVLAWCVEAGLAAFERAPAGAGTSAWSWGRTVMPSSASVARPAR